MAFQSAILLDGKDVGTDVWIINGQLKGKRLGSRYKYISLEAVSRGKRERLQ